MNNKDFKFQLESSIIPTIEKMIKSETNHLSNLMEMEIKFNDLGFIFISKPDFKNMIAKSKAMKEHLELRLNQYLDYTKKL